MTDDDLRAALRASHADDNAPPFARTVDAARSPRRRRTGAVIALAAAATLAVLLLVLVRHRASRQPEVALGENPPARSEIALDGLGMRTTALNLPTDSLLDIPGHDLLSTTPDLTGGALP